MVRKGRPRKMTSKRISCRKKYKIEKKVRDHNKKVTKEAKKKKSNGIKMRGRKDPGVPGKAPFKEQVLREAEERRQRIEEDRARQKEMRAKQKDANRNLESLKKSAEKRQKEYEQKASLLNQVSAKNGASHSGAGNLESSKKAYYQEFRKVVEAADVVIEVLDARDPLGCRCPQVEEAVIALGARKKIILLLNKIDLVPRENVEKWLKYLKNEFPTVAFKASTQSQKKNLSQSKITVKTANKDLLQSSVCLGADTLMKLLANYCRNIDIKTSITVGIVGFPNVGKSSVINSLKRSKACNVGSTPGVTKSMQEVHLDKHIKLLDSPGIVMATGSSEVAVVLRNCVKIETLVDPVTPVSAILKRCNKQQVVMFYSIPNYSDTNEFLSLLAKKRGQLRKGGVPNIEKAAKSVLLDWNSGKIGYYTHPPEDRVRSAHLSAEIVNQMGQQFDLRVLENEEKQTLEELKKTKPRRVIKFESMGLTRGCSNSAVDEDEEEMDGDEEEMDGDGDEEGSQDAHNNEKEYFKEEEEMFEEGDDEEDEDMDDDETSKANLHLQENSPKVNIEIKNTSLKKEKGHRAGSPELEAKFRKKTDTKPDADSNKQYGKEKKQILKKMKKQRRRADTLATKLSDDLNTAMNFTLNGDSSGEEYDFATDFK